MHKITQPFFLITQPLHKKITQRPQTKTQKSCNLSTHKITQALNKKTHTNSPPKKKSCNLSTKKSQKSQNTALRTSHWLSNVSNCTFPKNRQSKKKKDVAWFFCGEVAWFFSLLSILTLLSLLYYYYYYFFFFTFSVLLERAIWQPMWCSQGSVLWFSWCFCFIKSKSY